MAESGMDEEAPEVPLTVVEDFHDLKLNGGSKEGTGNDPSSYKACQFYLHEFKTTEPEARNPVNNFVGERAEVITEIQ